ncbi:MAG: RnfABCDGE type electron transport complex subunit B [Kiritimatiellia bacterium]|jgi:electron transport complex protein RnfB
MSTIFITTLALTLIGLVCGVALAVVAKKFAVQEDARIAEVEAALPGANCGGCGYPGCSGYAKAIVEDGAPINKCGPGGASSVERIGRLLGREAAAPEPVMAFIRCAGDRAAALRSSVYNGVTDCAAAQIVAGGWKECQYGCLGFGSCARACEFGAIVIRNGLAVVDPARCTGCGRCVTKCPRNLIVIVPVKHRVHVRCNSPEKGAVVRKSCSSGCIGCGLCVKAEGGASMRMDGALARVDYDKPPVENEAVATRCPTKNIVKLP